MEMSALIAASRIDDLITVCRDYDLHPIFLGQQYFSKTIEDPVAHILKPLVREVTARIGVLEPSELESFISSIPENWSMFIGEPNDRPANAEFLERIGIIWLAYEMSKTYYRLDQIVRDQSSPSAVLAQYPELEPRFDKHGLLILDAEMELRGGGIFYQESVLHYHQLLRRGYTSSPNMDFLQALSRFRSKRPAKGTVRIAIDHRRIMPQQFYWESFEKDVWYGPRFNLASLDDPHDVASTILTRSRPSPFDASEPIDRTEIHRCVDGVIKTYEIEEVRSPERVFDGYILNRYIHAERDMSRHTFRHFDGAVKAYAAESYGARHAIRKPTKDCLKKIKLFRVDGQVDADDWIELAGTFFRGNEMIVEHFDASLYQEQYRPTIERYQEALEARSVRSDR
jgi:hypothetical protein